ncbi:hypothetical protein ASPZODRAFT_17091 [Penicilliopsis zonata CBS 506.65]|uniref:FAD-binding FR-type domain-containing protein n=1 Tax=Penicilliopsis zonata CBS 506.65 TaxID=1073090 RepID=A0A1L9SEJ4_9EURO|nr:hypothetical protein ASPZODRAFT_17091 [Penicilliopsis zonata CBS 506.65]OJJ45640.1 hypothetical protein ASPZODRAFT_17091 [Penicilliopsis zonata CBS 506.65]
MEDLTGRLAPRSYGTNATYIYYYSRGLGGVNVSEDDLISWIILGSILVAAMVILCGRVAQVSHAYLRQISSLTATRKYQTFWSIETSYLWANLKKHVLYAPLGNKRHNREMQLSSALNMGTLPSRFHSILLLLYIVSQIVYCCYLNYSENSKAALWAELRGRSGVLAVLNMVPLFILAGRNNPLISLLHVSFDTYNLLHRWLGRIVMVESVVHTVAWAVNAIDEQSFEAMLQRLADTPFFFWGMVGTCGLVFLVCHSLSPIRHAFYETFLHLHQLAALLACVGIYLHLKLDDLPQIPWFQAIAGIWIFDRTARLLRLIYLNFSFRNGTTRLVVEALPGEACRVTYHLPKRVHFDPGCHVYAYIPSISKWMSHPFSVAWVEPGDCVTDFAYPAQSSSSSSSSSPAQSPLDLEKQTLYDLDGFPLKASQKPTSVSLIVGARQGMTRKLYNTALAAPKRTLYISGAIEGPYQSHPSSFGSYGTAVLFSAGAGITHHMLHVRDLLIRAAEGRVATRKICLVWSVRNTDHLSWVREYMDSILRLPNRREVLTIKLFVSKPKSSREITSPSASVQMFPGRCRPDVVLDEFISQRVGAVAVSVCGPGAFADEVRVAARSRIGKGAVVDFFEEAFTW